MVDVNEIAGSGIRLGVDPLGGASLAYWQAIADRHRLDLEVVNDRVDPTFSFMPLDHDGKIRMDCSSPDAMADLIALKDRFDVAFANDPDADRHGIVTREAGLLSPNHYLAASIAYLLGGVRLDWREGAGVGKTMVSSSIIDRVVAGLGRRLEEVPVGFKWFVAGLLDGTLAFGGEESAGASFLRRDGHAWSTDKDGLIMCLLAAEMTARTGKDPGRLYAELTDRYGAPAYRRIDAPATPEQKRVLGSLSPESRHRDELAGEPIKQVLTAAPSGAPLGGVKVVTDERLVRGTPVGNRGRVQAVCGELQGSGCTSSGSSRRPRPSSTLLWGSEHDADLRDGARRRGRQEARAAHGRPGQARGAVRRRVPADRLRPLEPRQCGIPADRRADPVQEPLARPPHFVGVAALATARELRGAGPGADASRAALVRGLR